MFYDSEDDHKKPSQMESDADFSSGGETSESEDDKDDVYTVSIIYQAHSATLGAHTRTL